MKPILSIGITSYKRLKELERCINSIQTKYVDEIEVIVSEDCSPLSKEIGELVNKMATEKAFTLKFAPNEHNLGYDGNLGAIIKKSQGKFVFLCSDDDSIFEDCLDGIIEYLRDDKGGFGVFYAPFVYGDTRRKDRNHRTDMDIVQGEENACKYIYDSILFSGLIFRKEYVEKMDVARFKNMNYFQVYMFLKMVYHYGAHYFAYPSILCVGDGENAYGIAESSGGNALLADRTSVLSNLEFDKTLSKVIMMFDEEEGTHVFSAFESQYSLRSYSLMSLARLQGRTFFKDYWKKLNSQENIKLKPIARIYYWMLLICGTKLSNKLTYVARRLAKRDDKFE